MIDLTEDNLTQALMDVPCASVIVVGTRAKFAAQRILWSHDPNGKPAGPLFGVLRVHEDPKRGQDEWELF